MSGLVSMVFPYVFHIYIYIHVFDIFHMLSICFRYISIVCFFRFSFHNTLRDHSLGPFVCRLDGVMRENGYLPG